MLTAVVRHATAVTIDRSSQDQGVRTSEHWVVDLLVRNHQFTGLVLLFAGLLMGIGAFVSRQHRLSMRRTAPIDLGAQFTSKRVGTARVTTTFEVLALVLAVALMVVGTIVYSMEAVVTATV